MTTVDELFDRYKAAFTAARETDPRPYLAQLTGSDRRELEALIDGFLERAPARPYDAARAAADPLTRRAMTSLMAEIETWRTLLPGAEANAGLSRAEVVDRLAAELGVADKRDKVHRRYHEMEHGRLQPERVQPRVLEALAGILSVPFDRLVQAGRRMAPPAAGAPAVFARSASIPAPATAPPSARVEEDPWDEVDELFKGG